MADCSRTSLRVASLSISKQYDVILVGDSNVGKSCILRQMCEQTFSDDLPCTVGMGYRCKDFELENGQVVKLKIHDTMGEEKYAQLMSVYFRGAQAAILVYDITDDSSFNSISTWINTIRKFNHDKGILFAIVGNKLDFSNKRKVTTNLGLGYAESHDMMFFETSAKTGENVKELFYEIARKLAVRPVSTDVSQPVIIIQGVLDTSKQERRGCCLFSTNNKTSSSTTPQPLVRTVSSADARYVLPKSVADLVDAGTTSQLSSDKSKGAELTDCSHSQRASTDVPVLGISDLHQVKQELQDVRDKWFDLGLGLGLLYPTLKEIEGPNKSKNECMTDMLAAWLKQQDDVDKRGGPTWQQLSKTLREMKCKSKRVEALSKRVEKHAK